MRNQDIVDELVDQWRLSRPDLDDDAYEAITTIGRMARIGVVLTPLLERAFAGHGIGRGEYEILASLRRLGEPYRATPMALARQLLLSPGAITNRLDGLEKTGYLTRVHDPDNRRSVLVTLTPSGRELIDAAVDAHVANAQQLLGTLNVADRRRLDSSLRRLLDVLEKAAETHVR